MLRDTLFTSVSSYQKQLLVRDASHMALPPDTHVSEKLCKLPSRKLQRDATCDAHSVNLFESFVTSHAASE